ncbi:MAG: hypothetical protein WCO12_03570 [bacterium]
MESHWFNLLMSLLIFANPLAILPQTVSVFRSASVAGVSTQMWFIFAAIQAAFVFQGIKTKNFTIFVSMLISLIESITIIVVVYLKT